MPAPKTSRKSKSAPSKNQYTAELSSSQLVLGISILMVFGLACFLFGVLIGKFDRSLRPEQQVADSTTSVSDAQSGELTEKVPAGADRRKSSEQRSVSTRPVVEEKDIVVKTTKPPKTVKPATQIPKSGSVGVTDVTDIQPIQSRKVDIPKDTPLQSVAKPQIAKVEQPKDQAGVAAKPVISPTAPSKGGWGVQVGAFKNATSAEVERKRLEAKIPFKIEIQKRPGNEYNQLIIGRYETRSEANAFKQTLIDTYNMAQPFLVNRN